MIFVLVFFACLAWWSVFWIIRFGSMDPHHVEASAKPFLCGVMATVIVAVLALLPGLQELKPGLATFLGMFILGQTAALPFTVPDQYREDEVADPIERLLENLKSRVSGGVLLKIGSIVVAFLTSWLFGNLWFVIVIFVGFVLLMSKGKVAKQLILSGPEFSGKPVEFRVERFRHWSNVVSKGLVAYPVGCIILGAVAFMDSGLQPGNWHGWVGLILGTIVSAFMKSF